MSGCFGPYFVGASIGVFARGPLSGSPAFPPSELVSEPHAKLAHPTISRSHTRSDSSWATSGFSDGPETIRMCQNATYAIKDIGTSVLTALGNRRRTDKMLMA